MLTLTFGEGLTVNRMGFGAMRLCGPGVWGLPEDEAGAWRVLQRAVELGVNFIDTANAYGPGTNEEQIAQALYPYRDGLVIATKGGPTRPNPGEWGRDCRPERLKQLCDESLLRLKLDEIALYQLHCIDRAVPFEEQIGALADLRNAGKIANIGLSNVSLGQLRAAQTIAPIASVQEEYNVHTQYGNEIVDYCERQGMAFIAYFPLDAGEIDAHAGLRAVAKARGVSVFQIALAWLLHRSPCIIPIPGTHRIAHLEQNVAAASLQLTDEEFKSIA